MKATLREVLLDRAAADPGATALVFADGDERRPITRADLTGRAMSVAAALADAGVRPGDRALLLFPPGEEYVVGFLGCLYAGVIAVPAFPPGNTRGLARVEAIARDAQPCVALTDSATAEAFGSRFGGTDWVTALRVLTTDTLDAVSGDALRVDVDASAVAFLQYTSGSTATPKGVMVTQGNLVNNCQSIADAVGIRPDTRAVSWLPPYHDMGLIGGILQPLYSGFPGLLMPPLMFLHRPATWLQAISDFGATASAAPNFAFMECVRRLTDEDLATLDLSRWTHALVGAEPVRGHTLDLFAARFADRGFRRTAYLPCYGLAEATLFVTGGRATPEPARLSLDRAALVRDEIVRDTETGAEYVSCGGPVGRDRVAVVDPETRRPVTGVGEIWVSGPSIARGYWAERDGGSETFGARIAGDDAPWMRTGDLGFFDGGELYVTGRRKELIVVRGGNHYPPDIERTAESASPAILPGRSAAFGIDDGSAERVVLVSEAPRDTDAAAAVAAILAAVADTHGLALDDVVLIRPGGLPRTSSGKIQRTATRDLYLAGKLASIAAPRVAEANPAAETDPLVARVAAIVAAELDRSPQSIDTGAVLVGQGLDSLRAIRVRAALAAEFGHEPELADLLTSSTMVGLARACAKPSDRVTTVAVSAAGPARASFGQERLWLLDQLGAGAAYHLAGVVWMTDAPDRERLRVALRTLVDRHESLRTGVRAADDGTVVQLVSGGADIDLPVERATDRETCVRDLRIWADQPFRLDEPPLLRVALRQVMSGGWALALSAHHAAVDGWSFGLLLDELGAVYAALSAGAEVPAATGSASYRAVATAQRERLESAAGRQSLAWWVSRMAGATPPDLGEAPREPHPARAHVLPVALQPDTAARLRRLARDEGGTVFMALSAALSTLLGRWSGSTDVLIGTVSAGRAQSGTTGLVGFLANTVPLRVDLSDDPSFRALVGRAATVCRDAYQHEDVPFEQIVADAQRARRSDRPLVRHLLVLQPEIQAPTIGEVEVLAPAYAKFELELELIDHANGSLTGSLIADSRIFAPDTVQRLVDGFGALLDAATERPDGHLSTLPTMSAAETATVTTALSGIRVDPVTEPTVVDEFESRVDADPHATAVIEPDGTEVDYATIDERANRVAHALIARGIGAEDRVGILLDRGSALTVSILGVLKSGAAYLAARHRCARRTARLPDRRLRPESGHQQRRSGRPDRRSHGRTVGHGPGQRRTDHSAARAGALDERRLRAVHLRVHRVAEGGDQHPRRSHQPADLGGELSPRRSRRSGAAEDTHRLRRLGVGVAAAARRRRDPRLRRTGRPPQPVLPARTDRPARRGGLPLRAVDAAGLPRGGHVAARRAAHRRL